MDLVPESDGSRLAPAFPPGVGFLLLADAPESSWGLYRFDDPNEEWTPAEPVGDRLRAVIGSGERYPPSLALARDAVTRQFPVGTPSRDEVLEVYAMALERCLALQPTAPFVLARATVTEPGYLEDGEWYWIVAVREGGQAVGWVSEDYYVYTNRREHFAVAEQQVQRLVEWQTAQQAAAADGRSGCG